MKQTRRTAQKPKVFEATSEEDTCSGFEENVISKQIKAMVSNPGVLKLFTKTLRFLLAINIFFP